MNKGPGEIDEVFLDHFAGSGKENDEGETMVVYWFVGRYLELLPGQHCQ